MDEILTSGDVRASVCMATHNGQNYVGEQIASIISQIGEQDEIVIIDDASSDNTVRTIHELLDGSGVRFKVLENATSHGPARAFGSAISASSGKFIFLSDQDDVWVGNKLEVMLDHLGRFDLVMSDAEVVDENLEVTAPSFYAMRKSGPGLIRNFVKCRYVGCCMAFRREVAEAALPVPSGAYMHDVWIGLVAELLFEPVFVTDKLIKYRRHSANATSTVDMDKGLSIAIARRRIALARSLVIRMFRLLVIDRCSRSRSI